jgi:hypothetical protein
MNRTRAFLALLILSLLLTPGCDSSDPVASEGSTIIVTANPKDIPEALRGILPSTISAIVLNSSGIRQIGVEVILTAEEGCFSTDDNNCLLGGGSAIAIVLTDSDGIASADLYTFTSTTVSARSGSAVDEETVSIGGQQVVDSVNLIALEDIGGGVPRDTVVEFRATVIDTDGLPVVGAVVNVDVDPTDAGVPAFPNGSTTDSDGRLEFEVEVLDQFDIRVQVTDVLSNTVTVLILTP